MLKFYKYIAIIVDEKAEKIHRGKKVRRKIRTICGISCRQ